MPKKKAGRVFSAPFLTKHKRFVWTVSPDTKTFSTFQLPVLFALLVSLCCCCCGGDGGGSGGGGCLVFVSECV